MIALIPMGFTFQVSFLLLLAGSGAPECGDNCTYKTSAIAIGYVIGLIPVLAVIIRAIVQIFITVKVK